MKIQGTSHNPEIMPGVYQLGTVLPWRSLKEKVMPNPFIELCAGNARRTWAKKAKK